MIVLPCKKVSQVAMRVHAACRAHMWCACIPMCCAVDGSAGGLLSVALEGGKQGRAGQVEV